MHDLCSGHQTCKEEDGVRVKYLIQNGFSNCFNTQQSVNTWNKLAVPSNAHHFIHCQPIIQQHKLNVRCIKTLVADGWQACWLPILLNGLQCWLTAIENSKFFQTPLHLKPSQYEHHRKLKIKKILKVLSLIDLNWAAAKKLDSIHTIAELNTQGPTHSIPAQVHTLSEATS